ncbi:MULTISPECIES: TRAP transporter small permease [Fusobacterium]|uniref:TRAP transporter small permease n=1 Tax=Fusobacterium TaxID=848 RepID=UPI0014769DCD|nr:MULTISPECIES: TRAP transporter small permease [Fusobacterium]NME36677.1 TRAP transporter small permease [Fusobacterium sp. FSA-380-WT-3A]
MNKIDCFMENLLKFIMGLATLILSVVTALQVVARFIFSNPIAWGQDIIRLSFVYLVFFGGAYCVHTNEHLNIDAFINLFSEKNKKILSIFIECIVFLFFIFLIYYGSIFVKTGINQKAPYLPISMSLYYFSLPLSSFLMAYFELRKIITLIKGGAKK